MDSIEAKLHQIMEDLQCLKFPSTGENTHSSLADDLKVVFPAQSLGKSAVETAHFLARKFSSRAAQSFLAMNIFAEKVVEETTSSLIRFITESDCPPQNSTHLTAAPTHIKLCQTWLLSNLHNPYPSTRICESIAQQSGVSRKDIGKWMSNARARIGWNSTRKRFFSNKRTKIVDTATFFFTEAEDTYTIDPAIKRAFVVIKERARNLCGDGLSGYSPPIELATEDKELMRQTQRFCQSSHERNGCPLPDDASPPSVPISLVGRKRRSPSVDPPRSRQGENSFECRLTKRPRFAASSTPRVTVDLPSGLPLPGQPQRSSEVSTSTPVIEAPAIRNRKRRLSESSSEVSTKRPRNSPSRPRAQAVSDPLPSSFISSAEPTFGDWIQPNFDFNTLLNIETINSLALDVEWGSLPELDSQSTTDSDGGSPDSQLTSELPQTELASLLVEGGNFTSQPSESFIIEDSPLLFNTPGVDIVEHTLDLPISLRHLDLDLSKNQDDLSLKPSLPIIEASLSSFDSTWDLLDFTGTESLDSVFDSIRPLDEIPLVTELPPIYSSQAARAEKERRLREVQEEAKRLELELSTTT